MDDNPYQSSPLPRRRRLPARLSEERVVLGVYAVSVVAAFLGLVLLRFH
jgi:hypothetical protein